MKNSYCSLFDKLYLSEDKKEEIYCLLEQSIQADGAQIAVYKPQPAKSKFKVKAIPVAAVAVAAVCALTILFIYLSGTRNTPIQQKAEAIIYNPGVSVTDVIYGNTICIECARLTESVTADGEDYYSDNGKFLVIYGTADIDLTEITFDEESVYLLCRLSDVNKTISFDFRSDLFEKSYKNEVKGEISLIFEIDNGNAENMVSETEGSSADYAEAILYLYDFKVYGTEATYAAVGYSFTFDEVITG